MKYIIIPYIALGVVLSAVFGLEYRCEGLEMFPDYFGSPLVFKRTSLASSMEYHYSILGLATNVLIWSILIIIFKTIYLRLTKYVSHSKIYKLINIMIVCVLLVFSTFIIFLETTMMGSGFDNHLNYWYFDLDGEAKKWNMDCTGQWTLWMH